MDDLWSSRFPELMEKYRAGVHAEELPVSVPMPVRVLVPHSYQHTYAYPLLVMLHGWGSNDYDLIHLASSISPQNYVCMSLRGLEPCTERPDGEFGYSWGRTESLLSTVEDYVMSAMARVQQIYHIHSQRIFLVGFSQGASVAYRLALRHDRRFAGVITLAGWLPTIGANDVLLWQSASHLRVFIGHGTGDKVVPMCAAVQSRDKLLRAGLDVTFRKYPCGHGVSPAMLRDVNHWVLDTCTAQS